MRARIDELERELVRMAERVGELEPRAAEAERLRSRVQDLERELSVLKPAKPPAGESARAKRRRAAEEARARTQSSAEQGEEHALVAWLKRVNSPAKLLLGAVGIACFAGLAYWQFAPPTWTNSLAPPSIGWIDLGRTPTPPMVHGSTRGVRPTPSGCVGMIPSAPHLVLTTQAQALVLLDVESEQDTVLVVLDASGTVHCDDDAGGGHDPYLAVPLPPGEARVWVGTYSGDEHAQFSLTLATREGAAMPDSRGIAPSAPARLGTLGASLRGTRRLEGTILGVTSATTIDRRCQGYIETAPTLTLDLAEPTYVDLQTGGQADLTLFLESAGVIHCDDDSGAGTNARWTELLAAGTHHVWVGTYSRQSTPTGFWLEARMAPHADLSVPPSQPLSMDQPVDIEARTEAIVRSCGMLVPASADTNIDLAEPLDVTTSAAMLVVTGSGRRCLRPGVSTWEAGRHAVFLGVDLEASQPTASAATLEASSPSVLPYR